MDVNLLYDDSILIKIFLFTIVKVLPLCVLLFNLIVICISLQILLE